MGLLCDLWCHDTLEYKKKGLIIMVKYGGALYWTLETKLGRECGTMFIRDGGSINSGLGVYTYVCVLLPYPQIYILCNFIYLLAPLTSSNNCNASI